MTGHLAQICRHPIKSIGYEELAAVTLTAGRVLPGDRRWAVAHQAAAFAGQPDRWHAKRNFVRGVAAPALMAVRARLSADGTTVALTRPGAAAIEVAPDRPEGAARLLDWIRPVWPESRPPADRVVTAAGDALADMEEPFVSILSLGSLADLGRRMGQPLSVHRFRGNLWLDGIEPWAEWDWVGRELQIGAVRLRIDMRITRCRATCANPETGEEDGDTLAALDRAFGHRNFGLYATVIEGGALSLGDPVELLA